MALLMVIILILPITATNSKHLLKHTNNKNKTNLKSPTIVPTLLLSNKVTVLAANEDAAIDNALDNLTTFVDNINITNDESKGYFCISCKSVTLHSSPNIPPDLTIIDSGAYPMMFNSPKYFIKLHPWNHTTKHVTLADGITHSPIQGTGTACFLINNKHPVEFHNALYIPNLSSNLYYIKEFIRYQGTYLLAVNNNITLAFPSFITDATIGDELFIITSPTNIQPIFSTITTSITQSHHITSKLNIFHLLPVHKHAQPLPLVPPTPDDKLINTNPPDGQFISTSQHKPKLTSTSKHPTPLTATSHPTQIQHHYQIHPHPRHLHPLQQYPNPPFRSSTLSFNKFPATLQYPNPNLTLLPHHLLTLAIYLQLFPYHLKLSQHYPTGYIIMPKSHVSFLILIHTKKEH